MTNTCLTQRYMEEKLEKLQFFINQYRIYHCIKSGILNMDIKIYNNLPSFIKRTLDNSKEFKSPLRIFFYSNPFYTMEEYFNHNTSWWLFINIYIYNGDYINIFGIALYYISNFIVIINILLSILYVRTSFISSLSISCCERIPAYEACLCDEASATALISRSEINDMFCTLKMTTKLLTSFLFWYLLFWDMKPCH